jgi:hypothetical protein
MAKGDSIMSKTKNATKNATKVSAKRETDVVPINEAMKKPAKDMKLSCLGAAVQVLKSAGEPMNCVGMIEAMKAKQLWTPSAPTPASTLYSAILRELKTKKREARFKKVDRGQFALA